MSVEPSQTTAFDGRQDLDRSAVELAARLPDPLHPLARLAYNYHWSWQPRGAELFEAISPGRFAISSKNPVRVLLEASRSELLRASEDQGLLDRGQALLAALDADLARSFETRGAVDPARPVAFLCAEYGIHVSLPIYSGGLGALAGDLVKEASDQAVPLVAVGLLYRKGYFRQRIDATGWQHEYWLDTDPDRLPMALVTGADGQPISITIPIYEANVTAHIWRADIGRIPLYLLDTDTPANEPFERWITGRLYVADPETRLAQYVLLGMGGVRALRAMGIEPGVVHLNEGHGAFAPLELAAPDLQQGTSFDRAITAASQRTIFTTHTPVPAGNDSYPDEQVARAVGRVADDLDVDIDELISLGRTDPSDEEAEVRRDAGGPAHEPGGERGQPPTRRGRPRDVERAVAGSSRQRRADRHTSPTGSTSRRGSARRYTRTARPVSRRGLDSTTPPIPQPGPRSMTSRTRRCGRPAVVSAPR